MHYLTTRSSRLDQEGRVELLRRTAIANGIVGEATSIAHYPTGFRRTEDVVRQGRSGVIYAIGGEAAVSSAPLGGFGVNMMLSVVAPAAAKLALSIFLCPDESAHAAHSYRFRVEDAASFHHARTVPRWLHYSGVKSPYLEGAAQIIPLRDYPFAEPLDRGRAGAVLELADAG
jgi:hypothetical protein